MVLITRGAMLQLPRKQKEDRIILKNKLGQRMSDLRTITEKGYK